MQSISIYLFKNRQKGVIAATLVLYFLSGRLPGIESFTKLHNLISFFTKDRRSFLAPFTATAIQRNRFVFIIKTIVFL